MDHAASLGARCVSLAGMIPSLTGYGYDVLRETAATTTTPVGDHATTTLTTGHATTTVAVVKTVRTALEATGRDLGELTLAVVGCGSIGTSSLRLLLSLSPHPPARLLLCDVPGSTPRLQQPAAELSADHPTMAVQIVESADPRSLPAEVYATADVIVTAVSGGPTLLDVDRLRPGTIVVDDSFPHCFDTGRALDRMRHEQDVLIVGGGLLALDSTETHLSPDLPAAALTGHATARTQQHLALHLPGTLASCRLESLLHAHLADPGLRYGTAPDPRPGRPPPRPRPLGRRRSRRRPPGPPPPPRPHHPSGGPERPAPTAAVVLNTRVRNARPKSSPRPGVPPQGPTRPPYPSPFRHPTAVPSVSVQAPNRRTSSRANASVAGAVQRRRCRASRTGTSAKRGPRTFVSRP